LVHIRRGALLHDIGKMGVSGRSRSLLEVGVTGAAGGQVMPAGTYSLATNAGG
jgi:hypothetical protein